MRMYIRKWLIIIVTVVVAVTLSPRLSVGQLLTQTLLADAFHDPGAEVVSPGFTLVLPSGNARLQLTAVQWDDPDLTLTLILEQSRDGRVTWQHRVSANILGTERDKFGNLPAIGVGLVAADQGTDFRARFTLSKRFRVGVDAVFE